MKACPGCGPARPETGGPTQAHLSASPECRALYGRSLDLHCSDPASWPAHQPLVDACALEHSTGGDRRSRKSAGLHLAALALRVEGAGEAAPIAVRRAPSERADRPRLDPPAPSVTVAAVSTGEGPAGRPEGARAPARAVWADWMPHRAAARRLLAGVPG